MWNPPMALSPEEQKMAARTQKARKFFVFLRTIRHARLDADFQQTLAKSESPEPGGKAPVDAGGLALATLLQAYGHVSDQDAVELTVMDKRWQMVWDGLGAEHPPFSRGTLCHFRLRLIAHNLDKTLLDRTVALAEQTGGFGARHLRAALDSTPLCGAGRVEDTRTLLGHALRKAVGLAAKALATSAEVLMAEAGLALVGQSSLKAALALDWGAPPPGQARGAWSWRRWSGGQTGASSRNASRRRSRPGRQCWRPSSRWSRRILSQTRREDRADGASSSTWPPTAASPLKTPTCATAARAAPRRSTASKSPWPWTWTATSHVRWSSVRPTTRTMRPWNAWRRSWKKAQAGSS